MGYLKSGISCETGQIARGRGDYGMLPVDTKNSKVCARRRKDASVLARITGCNGVVTVYSSVRVTTVEGSFVLQVERCEKTLRSNFIGFLLRICERI